MTRGPVKLYDENGRLVVDGSLSPAPGGGSQPGLSLSIPVADILARWDDGDGVSAIELAVPAGSLIVCAAELPGDGLDNSVTFNSFQAYLPGQSSADAWENGETVPAIGDTSNAWTTGTYRAANNGLVPIGPNALEVGAALYAVYRGESGRPTAGTSEIRVAYVPPPA